CPELDLSYINPLCTNSSMINLEDYLVNPSDAPGVWIVTAPSGEELEMNEIDPALLEAGDYMVSFQFNDGTGNCPDTATSELNVYQQPEVNIITADYVVCNVDGGTAPRCIDLSTFVSGSDGEWSQPTGYNGDFSDITNICFDGIAGGTVLEFNYSSDVAQFPCQDVSGLATIIVEDCSCPILNIFNPGPICNEGDVLDLNELEANGIADGQWSVVDGPQSISLNNEVFEADQLMAGEYTLQYTPMETPEVHCDQFSQVTLQVVAPLRAGTGDMIELCENDDQEINLFDILIDADSGGNWLEISQGITAGSAFDNTGSLQTEDLDPGQYDFEYLQDNDFPCNDQASYVSVLINEVPQSDAGEDKEVNCAVQEVTLGGINTSSGTDYTYSWTSVNGSLLNDSTSATIKVNEAGEYILEVIHLPTGCLSVDAVIVTEDDNSPSFEAEVISSPCDLNSLGIISIANATGGDGLYEYSIDNGQSWTNDNSFTGLADGEYTVVMQDGRGCTFEQSGLIIQQSSPMGLNAGEDTTVDYGDAYYNLQVSITADPADIVNVIWQEDGITICEGTPDECFYIQVDPVEINTYCVTLTDLYGCEYTDCVVLEEELDADVYIPNIFDPTAVDNNNRFYVQSGEYVTTVNEMRVYDRWGSLIFEGEPDHAPNLPEYGWDGRINGEKVREGIYMYFIRTTDILGQEKKHSGDVMLIR
ncbi:MAG: gliding motility-associated C-terminal domain-containing protein, partial [Bacteroidia bacterium]|nr:gliding motility-associated C-terminal domain-containing protein [Bacteroidia bacterium]